MKKLVKIVVVLLFLVFFLNLFKAVGQSFWPDFNVYYHAASVALHGGNPYTDGTRTGFYIYPPVSLVLFYPFALFSFVTAGRLWALFSIFCLLGGLWFLLKTYHKERSLKYAIGLGILAFNFFPVKFTLGMGQINNVVFLLVSLAIYFGSKAKEKSAGTLWGTVLALKYTPIFVLPYLLIRKRRRVLMTICITILLLFVLGFVVIRPDTTVYFLKHILVSLGLTSSWYVYYNQALSGFLIRDFRWIPDTQLTIIRFVISLIMLAFSLVVVTKSKSKDINLEISIFLTLNLLLNTFSEQHHFVLLLVPLVVTFFYLQKLKVGWQYYAVLAVCYFLVASNLKNYDAYPVLLQSHAFYGTLGVWLMDLYLLLKA